MCPTSSLFSVDIYELGIMPAGKRGCVPATHTACVPLGPPSRARPWCCLRQPLVSQGSRLCVHRRYGRQGSADCAPPSLHPWDGVGSAGAGGRAQTTFYQPRGQTHAPPLSSQAANTGDRHRLQSCSPSAPRTFSVRNGPANGSRCRCLSASTTASCSRSIFAEI